MEVFQFERGARWGRDARDRAPDAHDRDRPRRAAPRRAAPRRGLAAGALPAGALPAANGRGPPAPTRPLPSGSPTGGPATRAMSPGRLGGTATRWVSGYPAGAQGEPTVCAPLIAAPHPPTHPPTPTPPTPPPPPHTQAYRPPSPIDLNVFKNDHAGSDNKKTTFIRYSAPVGAAAAGLVAVPPLGVAGRVWHAIPDPPALPLHGLAHRSSPARSPACAAGPPRRPRRVPAQQRRRPPLRLQHEAGPGARRLLAQEPRDEVAQGAPRHRPLLARFQNTH
jgi:hypothetical protein